MTISTSDESTKVQEKLIGYERENDVDLYQQLLKNCEWFFKSLEFSILNYIPNAANDNGNSNRCTNNKNLVDLACGSGDLCRKLMDEYGYKTIVGIDKSENMIIKAKQLSSDLHHKSIKYIADDCCFMDKQFMLSSQSKFDIVVCQWLYLYANNVQELSLMIGNVSKLLKTDGVHVGCTTNPCLMADTMGDLYSEQWKEFGFETKCNLAMIKNKRMQFKDGEIRCSYASIFKLDEEQKRVQNEQKIGENCFELQGKFYTMDTYNTLFEKHGFTDVHWLSVDEYLAHPSLSHFERDRFQRYVRSNCIFAVFVMRKNGTVN